MTTIDKDAVDESAPRVEIMPDGSKEIVHKIPPACRQCGRAFKYGDIAARAHIMEADKNDSTKSTVKTKIVCEKCLKTTQSRAAEIVVFGGGKSSVVAREKAQRNSKKLVRAQKRSAKQLAEQKAKAAAVHEQAERLRLANAVADVLGSDGEV